MYLALLFYFAEIGEFEAVVGHHNAVLLISASKCHDMPLQLKAVRDCFTGMMTTNREQVETQLKLLVDRVKSMSKFETTVKSHNFEVLGTTAFISKYPEVVIRIYNPLKNYQNQIFYALCV